MRARHMTASTNSKRETPPPSPEPSARRGRPPLDPDIRRRHLLDIAARLFADRGYAETTLDAVGKSAGMTKRSIYELIGDKAALFCAVCNHSHASIGEIRLDLPVSGRSLRSNLLELAHKLVDHALDDRTIAVERTVVVEYSRFPALIKDINGTARDALNVKIAGVFSELISLGMIGPVDSFKATEIFFDLVVGNLGFRKTLGFEEDHPSDADVEERVDIFVEGFLRRHGLRKQ
jgi:TetR/AcrR family transcriptional repressor of mexJK operon